MLFVEKVAFGEAHATIHSILDHGHEHNHHHDHHESVKNGDPALSHSTTSTEVLRQVSQEGFLPPHIEAEASMASETTMLHDSHAQTTGTTGSILATESVESAPRMRHKNPLSHRSALILLAAMSFHSFFEAMALGVASDLQGSVLMATSIGLHQPAESMALLVAFLKTNMPNSSIMRWLGLFSLIAPVGLVTGMYVSSMSSPWLEGCIIAATAGTFLYVGATEVVNEEFEVTEGSEKFLKFASFVGGIVSILAISKFSEGFGEGNHHHHHHHHHDDAISNSWSFFGTSSPPSSQNSSA